MKTQTVALALMLFGSVFLAFAVDTVNDRDIAVLAPSVVEFVMIYVFFSSPPGGAAEPGAEVEGVA